jgi:hypothetical protein
MLRLGVRQLLMPRLAAEQAAPASAAAGPGPAHAAGWALGRGYDAPARLESLGFMRYGLLRFSGTPFACKKVGARSSQPNGRQAGWQARAPDSS